MIRINECGEPLVRIEKNMPFAIEERWNPNGVWLRKTVLDLLVEAKKNLPRGISFIIHSGWRSVDEQKQTFEETKSYLSRINPKVSKEKLLEMTKQYVHPYQGKKASGHLTGGAVDLRI